jgi:hypothetical protein
MNKKAYKLLIRSFDTELNAGDQRYLRHALEHSADLEAERKFLEGMRNTAVRSRVESFGPDFVGRVIQTIQSRTHDESEEPSALFPSLWAIFRPVALASAVIIVILASISFYSLKNYHKEGIDQIITVVEEANTLLVEEQLCMQQK